MLTIGGFTPRSAKFNQLTSQQQSKDFDQMLANWEAIFNLCQDSIITKDLNGIITAWNPASERIYGYSQAEMVGKPITQLFPPILKSQFGQIMSKIKNGSLIENYQTLRIRKDGKIIPISVSLAPIRNAAGEIVGASGIGRDISDQIELEKHKDDFIAIASHEFKTPLTSLKGFTQILLQKPEKLSLAQLVYLEKMNTQIGKLNQLVSDLLDVSQIQDHKMELNKKRFQLDDLISEVITQMQRQIKHQLIIKDSCSCLIWADRYRITQVLVNLISNAVKHSPKSDQIIIKTTKQKNRILISVQDFGIGILQKDQTKIFERFYQTRNRIRESFSGLGLGLFICDEIVKRHQGQIWTESLKGKGSIFFVSLPVK